MPEFVMNYCPRCGQPMADAMAYGKLRRVCAACDYVYFRDPAVAVVALVIRGGQALMVRRAMNPEIGKWAFPAGYLDYGEDPRAAAVREVREETGLDIRITGLIDVCGPDHQVISKPTVAILFRGDYLGGDLHAEDDVDQAAFLSRGDLAPADLAAFESIPILLAAWDAALAQL